LEVSGNRFRAKGKASINAEGKVVVGKIGKAKELKAAVAKITRYGGMVRQLRWVGTGISFNRPGERGKKGLKFRRQRIC